MDALAILSESRLSEIVWVPFGCFFDTMLREDGIPAFSFFYEQTSPQRSKNRSRAQALSLVSPVSPLLIKIRWADGPVHDSKGDWCAGCYFVCDFGPETYLAAGDNGL